jgi:HK97 family phage prohead protease
MSQLITTSRITLDAIALSGGAQGTTIRGTAMHFDKPNANGWAVKAGGLDVRRLPVMLWSHQESEVIGSWTNVLPTADGLLVEGKLNPAVQRAQEALALVKAGNVSGLSVGLRVEPSDVRQQGDTVMFLRAELAEISVVAIPADDAARISAVAGVRDCEALLKRLGVFSTREAKRMASAWNARGDNSDEITEAVAQIKALRPALRGF